MNMNLLLSHPRKVLNQLVYVFFIGYIAFIPIGPYPILFLGTKLDIFIAGVLLLLLLPKIPQVVRKYPPLLIYALYFYMCILLLSVVLSSDPLYSMRNWIVTLGYVLLCFLAPIVISSRGHSARTIFLILGVGVSVVIFILYRYMGYGQALRFALGHSATAALEKGRSTTEVVIVVDSNTTAVGLYMTILFYIPNLYTQKRLLLRRCVEFCAFVVIGAAATITLARTAVISFTLSILLTVLLSLFRGFVDHQSKYIWKSVLVLLTFLLLVIGALVTFKDVPFAETMDRILRSTQDTERIIIIKRDLIDVVKKNLKNLFIGQGYFTTNPHNEFLRNFSSSGFLGFVSFSMLFFAFYFLVVLRIRSGYYNRFAARALYFYIFFAVLTNCYTKSMWAPLMFILILYREEWLHQTYATKYYSSSTLTAGPIERALSR